MKERLFRVRSLQTSENNVEWVVPIEREDTRQEVHELQPVERAEPAEAPPTWRSLFAFTTRANWISIMTSGTGTIIAGVMKPVAAIFFGNIFSILSKFGAGDLSGKVALHHISTWCMALVALGIGAWMAEGVFFCAWILFGEIQARIVRTKLFDALLEKEQEWYDLREDGIGSLLIRIQTQIRELQLALSQPLGLLLFEAVAAIASIVIALYSTWKLTLVILTTFPLIGGILFLVTRGLSRAIEAQKRELGKASKYASTAFTAIDTIKACNGQNQEVWQYSRSINEVTRCYSRQARSNALQFGIVKFLMIGLFVLGFWFGVYLVNNGLDPGHVMTAFYACLGAMQAAETVLPQWLVLAKGMSAGETLNHIMRQMRHISEKKTPTDLAKPMTCTGDIEISNVYFAYPSNPQRCVLSNVSMVFPAGETTFVVGASGSGKSTIGNLLLKYYTPRSGSIMIDGRSIQQLDTEWIRRHVTLVQQDGVLFNETIRRNISFGNQEGYETRDVKVACETAFLNETIHKMPNGLDTLVGSGGRSLSGGQKQRVSIARARVRDAPILILDESTSALDNNSRRLIMARIREWRQGKTTIIITHDTSQILDDDYAYVLDNARLVREGFRRTLRSVLQGSFSSTLVGGSYAGDADRTNSPEPASSPEDEEEEDLSYRWQYISRVFTPINSSSKHIPWSPGTTQASGRSSFMWSNPRNSSSPQTNGNGGSSFTWSNPRNSSSPQARNSSRGSLVSFLSPIQTPRAPSPVFVEKERSRSSRIPIRSFDGEYKSSPDSGSRYSVINNSEGNSITPSIPRRSSDEPHNNRLSVPASNHEHEAPLLSLTQIFSSVWPLLTKRYRLIFLFGFFAALIVAVCTPAFAYLFARLLGVFYLPRDQRSGEAVKFALGLLGVAITDGLAAFTMHFALECSAQSLVAALRVEALKRILAQPKAWFDDERNSPSRLSECLDRNAEEMRNLVGRFAGPIFTVIWMLGISIIWAFVVSWKITLVALACGPVVYIIMRLYHTVSSKWEDRCNTSAENISSVFAETFANISVVRAFTLENYFQRKHQTAIADGFRTGLSRAVFTGALCGASDAIHFFITALIFYYGTVLITSGSHSVDSIIQVVNLLLFGIANASNMLAMMPQISSSRATATAMLLLASLPTNESYETRGLRRLVTPLPIQLTNLSFTHPGGPPGVKTLSNISLNIRAGTCTAIVGPSGSGKSTLLSILQCLYPPNPPRLLISPAALRFAGVSSENCLIPSLRLHISVVPQTPVLFPASILENITYGLQETSPYCSLSEAQRAAEQAGIHTFITSLDAGYGTQIGDGGMGLSGGQAQRIVIARALVRRPKLLILDEATSALDEDNAESVRNVVKGLVEHGMAVVVVSHSVEMMRLADLIVVIEDGKVVEKGEFEALCEKRGALTRLIGI